MGSKVITTYKENVPEGAQVAQVIEDLVKDGNKIIFATSFGFGDAMKASAKKHADVKFLHGTGAWHDPIPNFAPTTVAPPKRPSTSRASPPPRRPSPATSASWPPS